MDSIWRGTLNFGLVSIPVSVYSAVEESEHVSFRQLHKKDLAPIRYKKFCSVEDIEVKQDEIVKGYEVSKGKYAVLEKGELEDIQERLGDEEHVIEIQSFVDYASINPLSIERSHYLAPGKGGAHPYAVLREALLEAKRVGVARLFLRTRPLLAALIAGSKALSLAVMRSFEEMRDPGDLPVPERPKKSEEIRVARMLLDEMSQEWDPREHPDEYKASLEKLLASKKPAEVAVPAKGREGGKVIDLMEALRKSMQKRSAAASPARPKKPVSIRKGRSAKRAG